MKISKRQEAEMRKRRDHLADIRYQRRVHINSLRRGLSQLDNEYNLICSRLSSAQKQREGK